MTMNDGKTRQDSPSHTEEEREQRIRERAYSLWEGAGSPDGQADEHWHRARELIENDAERTSGGA